MKKLFILIVCIIVVGCSSSSEKIDIHSRAQDVVDLIAADGVDGLRVSITTEDKAIIENDNCQITLYFQNGKLASVYSLTSDTNKSEYSCVFRTIAKDKDLLGDDTKKYDEFLEKFREGKDFEFDNLRVTNNYFDMTIDVN